MCDLKLADLIVADNWNNVVDFRWHKHIQSPNWYVIEEEKQNLKSTIDEVVKDEEDEM